MARAQFGDGDGGNGCGLSCDAVWALGGGLKRRACAKGNGSRKRGAPEQDIATMERSVADHGALPRFTTGLLRHDLLNVGQGPFLVEKVLSRRVETEQKLEAPVGIIGTQFDSLPAGAFGPNQMSTDPSMFFFTSEALEARLARSTPLISAWVSRS
jgi:hypothetical protein